jgi:hypothetical protein
MKLLTALGLSVAILLTACGGSGTSVDGPNAIARFKVWANTKFASLMLEGGDATNPQVSFVELSASEVTVNYQSDIVFGGTPFVWDFGSCTYELRPDEASVIFDLKSSSRVEGILECPKTVLP